MNSKNSKPVGYSDRMDRVCAGGLVGAVWVERIFFDFLHLSRFHLLQIDKPPNKSLPSGHLPQTHKPNSNASISLKTHKLTNPQTATNPNQSKKKRERKREWKREREREREKQKKKHIQNSQCGCSK
jgi:hypothetical protein